MKVFVLHHIHHLKDDDDAKLIGIYTSEDKAKAAIQRVKDQPGFCEPDGEFEICEHQLDRDSWTEGFATIWYRTHGQD